MSNLLWVTIGLVLLSNIFDTVCQAILKHSINKVDTHVDSIPKALKLVWSLAKKPLSWVALIFSILSLFIWILVLTRADLNLAFSLDSMRYILIAFASVLFLKEKITAIRWFGILAVMVGIALVAIG